MFTPPGELMEREREESERDKWEGGAGRHKWITRQRGGNKSHNLKRLSASCPNRQPCSLHSPTWRCWWCWVIKVKWVHSSETITRHMKSDYSACCNVVTPYFIRWLHKDNCLKDERMTRRSKMSNPIKYMTAQFVQLIREWHKIDYLFSAL